MVWPLNFFVLVLSWELKDLLSCLKVGNNSSVVLATADDQAWVRETPVKRQDTWVVDIVESSHWVVRVSEIPNADRRILVVVTCYHKLSRNLWVPHHLSLFWLSWLVLLLIVSEVVVHPSWRGWRLSESKDWLVHFKIPHDNFSVFTCTCQDVRHNPVPAYWSDSRTFMMVWHTWLKHIGCFKVGRDILDQHFRTTTGKQVLFVWVELNRAYWHTAVNFGSRDAAFAHLEVLHSRLAIKNLSRVPKSDCSIIHTSSNYAEVILKINPVKWWELCWRLSDTLEHKSLRTINIVLRDS